MKKRILFSLILMQIFGLGLHQIYIKKQKLEVSYEIGRLVQKKQKLLQKMDKEIYKVEKLKNPGSILKKTAYSKINVRPADVAFFDEVYQRPYEEEMGTRLDNTAFAENED